MSNNNKTAHKLRALLRGKPAMPLLCAVCAAVVVAAAFLWYPPLSQSSYAPLSSRPFVRYAAQRVNVNTAPPEELAILPGIGEKRALAIVERREQYGPFRQPRDLLEVSGIGEKSLAAMLEWIEF